MTDEATEFDLPIDRNVDDRDATVDGLMTALDHASANYNHDVHHDSVQEYHHLRDDLYSQARPQLNDGKETITFELSSDQRNTLLAALDSAADYHENHDHDDSYYLQLFADLRGEVES